MLGRGPRLYSPQEGFRRWEGKASLMNIYFPKKVVRKWLSLYALLPCAFQRAAKGAGWGKCNKAGYSQQREKLLLLFVSGAGPANTSCSQPQLPAAFWWQKCIMDLSPSPGFSSQAGATALAKGVWFGAPSRTLPGLACPPLPAEPYWNSASFLQKKAPFCARKGGDKQTLCFEGSNSASRNETCLQCFFASQELQGPGSLLSISPKSSGTSEAPDAQG